MKNKVVLKMRNQIGNQFMFNEIDMNSFSFLNNVSTLKLDSRYLEIYRYAEIADSLDIEGDGSSKKRINELLEKKDKPKNEVEQKIVNLSAVYSFIENAHPGISKETIMLINGMLSTNIEMGGNKLEASNEFRRGEGVVGKFDTPSVEVMNKGMNHLIEFINDESYNSLIRAIVAHIAFIYYHPFYDFNGRTGRLLSHWLLSNVNEINVSKLLYISLNFNKKTYIKLWDSFRRSKSKDLDGWIHWFIFQLEESYENISEISNVLKKKMSRLNSTETSIIFKLIQEPEISYDLKALEESLKFGISNQGLHKAIESLEKNDLVKVNVTRKTKLVKINESLFNLSDITNSKRKREALEKYVLSTNDFELKGFVN